MDIAAEPYPFAFAPEHCALLIIDMQRDFLEPGGFGEMLGNDVSQLAAPSSPIAACWRPGARRSAGPPHPRGSSAGPVDLPPAKKSARPRKTSIGDPGPMGRILVRGEPVTTSFPSSIPSPASR